MTHALLTQQHVNSNSGLQRHVMYMYISHPHLPSKKKKKKSLKSRLLFPTVEEQDDDDLFEGDIKLTPEQKALLQSDDATIENWNRNARKWQRDHIPYVLDRSLCMLLITT